MPREQQHYTATRNEDETVDIYIAPSALVPENGDLADLEGSTYYFYAADPAPAKAALTVGLTLAILNGAAMTNAAVILALAGLLAPAFEPLDTVEECGVVKGGTRIR